MESGFSDFERLANNANKLHKKALNSEGVNPANQTNPAINIKRSKKAIFRLFNFFPIKNAMAENNDKCIPESATIWESPASLNASVRFWFVYSLAPVRSASKRAPPSPHPYKSLLKYSLPLARNVINLYLICENRSKKEIREL